MSGNDAKLVVSAEDRFSGVFAQLQRDLSGAAKQVQVLSTGALRLSGGIGAAAVGAASVGVGFALALKSLADDVDKLNDAQVIVGDTVENLSALEDVARRNGGSLDLVTTALVKMNKALKDADPDSSAAKALKEIGLNAAQLRSEAPSQALQDIALALSEFRDNGKKARITQELFGKSLTEVAPLLRDITEQGKLNATITTEQAKAAKQFNDTLYELQTGFSNLAREASGPFIEAFNEVNKALTGSGGVLKELDGIAAAVAVPLEATAVLGAYAAAAFKGIGTELGGIAAQAAALAQGDLNGFATIGKAMKEDAKAARLEVDAFADRILRVGAMNADTLAGFRKTASSFGGSLPSLGDLADKETKAARAQVSEAQRYLEALQKQGEKLEDLTALQQVLRDVEAKRIDGLTPRLLEQIKKEAEKVDLQKEINDAKEKEVGFQKLLADLAGKELKIIEDKQAALDKLFADLAAGGRNSALQLVADTDLARLEKAQVQLENLRALLDEPAFQAPDAANQVIEAIERIKESLAGMSDKGMTEFEKLADTIEKTMDRSTDAILDFVVDGQASTSSLWKAFERDTLRALIEDPVRDAMKNVAGYIKQALDPGAATGGQNILGSLLKDLSGSSGGSGNVGQLFDFLSSLFMSSGAPGFANGGSVRAGSLLRVNENGTETFIPGQDGVILNARQTRARADRGESLAITQVFNVNGDVSDRTVQMLEAMIDRNNAKIRRSMSTGGGWAPA